MLKFDRSSEVSVRQVENIDLIFVTFSVLKPVTSSDFSDSQLLNILFISVTFSVLRFSIPSTVSSDMQKANQYAVLVGA